MAKKLPKIINQDQAIRMFGQLNTNCATGARNHAMLMIMYRAGLRVSEVANLALDDMQFENGVIYIQSGKGDKDRFVPIDNDIISSCENWLKFKPQSEYFFCTMKGGQLDTRYIREMCYRISQKAEVYIQDGKEKKPVSPHKLRHSCMTSLLKEGFNIREVQEIAGHSNISTTQIYTHVTIDDLKDKYSKRPSLAK